MLIHGIECAPCNDCESEEKHPHYKACNPVEEAALSVDRHIDFYNEWLRVSCKIARELIARETELFLFGENAESFSRNRRGEEDLSISGYDPGLLTGDNDLMHTDALRGSRID